MDIKKKHIMIEEEDAVEEQSKKITRKGKNKIILLSIFAIIAIILIVAGIVLSTNTKEIKSNIQITSTEDMCNLINTVYTGLEDILPPTLNTQIVDTNNLDVLKSFTGLTSNENIDSAVVSEPMIGSQAYSFVLVKVKDGVNPDMIAKEMSEKVDTRKWICVQAEKLYATSVDNLVVLVMASDEWATPVYNKVKEILGAYNEEYTKINNDEVVDDGVVEY